MYFLMIIQLFNRKLPSRTLTWSFNFFVLKGLNLLSVRFQSYQGRLGVFSSFSQKTKPRLTEFISHATLDRCHWENAISIYSNCDLQLSPQGERQLGKILPLTEPEFCMPANSNSFLKYSLLQLFLATAHLCMYLKTDSWS